MGGAQFVPEPSRLAPAPEPGFVHADNSAIALDKQQSRDQFHDQPCYKTKLMWNISQQKCCINSFTDSECNAIPSDAASMPQTGRRNALKLLSGSFALASFPWAANAAATGTTVDKTAADGTLALSF